MKSILLASLLAITATISVASAAAPPKENTMDAPRRGRRPPSIPNMPEAALSPSNADVGDGDSFGRSVNFLGYAQTAGIAITQDCTGWPEGTCAVPDPNFSYGSIEKMGDEAVIRLPARSARSLLCFTTTPFGFASFINTSATRQGANMKVKNVPDSDALLKRKYRAGWSLS